jgi:hypothetical protein
MRSLDFKAARDESPGPLHSDRDGEIDVGASELRREGG